MTGFTMKEHYDNKKNSAKERGIDFKFTLETFTTFMSLRNTQRCFYTNQNFNLVRGTAVQLPDAYPTIERIDPSSCYSPDTCVWVTHKSNLIKAKYIEGNHSTFNLTTSTTRLINKIKKVLSNKGCMQDKMQPYLDAYKEEKVKNSVLIKKQKKEADLKALEEAETLKWSKEVEWSQYYIDTATEFSAIGVTLKETSGSLRKIVERKHKDDITGEKFNNLQDKKIWVIDKTKPIKQGNIKIVKLSSRNAIDVLTTNTDLGKIALSLHKVVEQVKEKS